MMNPTRAGAAVPRRHPGGFNRFAVLACVAFACLGCDGDEETAASDEARQDEALTGVAPDGTQIIFAGPNDRGERAVSGTASGEDQLIREPNEPDPEAGEFTLEEAVVGLPIDGSLVVELSTEFGTVLCDLYADRAPVTVANFIGLARGLRPWWDARAGEWVRRPYYRGLTFHRVIPGYLIQTGDYLGDGTGTVGYTIDDEPHDTLAHDRAGQLAMANHDGENTSGAQFFITDGPAPQLDGQGYTIFGQCRPQHVISQIARVPQSPEEGNHPLTPVHIPRLMIRRVEGGAAQAEPTRPQAPPEPRGASRPPGSDPRQRFDPRQYGEPSPLPNGRTGPPSRPRVLPHGGHQH